MINNYKIETKLGLRYYGGGTSSSNQQGQSTSSGSSSGVSTSMSTPQLTPEQLLSLYNTALPQMLSTAGKATLSASPTSDALAAANKGGAEGVNAINLNGLSPGEANAIERSSNQGQFASGNLGNSNALNTASNAMNFGGAFNNKIGILNNATNAASGAANAGSSALGATAGTFAPIANSATASTSLSNSIFGSKNQSQSANSGSSGSVQANLCYLTTACCEHKGLPDDCDELTTLRAFRDTYVSKAMVEQYYRLSDTIVPKIKNNTVILDNIYRTVSQCVRDIKVGAKVMALKRYSNMVEQLKGL